MGKDAVHAAAGEGGSRRRLSRSARKRARRKKKKATASGGGGGSGAGKPAAASGGSSSSSARLDAAAAAAAVARAVASSSVPAGVEVEYVSEEMDESDPMFAAFADVFAKFAKAEELLGGSEGGDGQLGGDDAGSGDGSGGSGDGSGSDGKLLSKRKRKEASRLKVAELKQLVARPELVEAHDATAADPRLLVYLKSYRNTVPVPRHWCHKRKYLQGKRGIEKPPFQLPEFIANTGISTLRSSSTEASDAKTMKQRGRERIHPTMGRIDIDYQVLHDAFFRFQTKPAMTLHGDLYYESKEFEVNLKHKKPGVLSAKLREALRLPDGAPPPWLFAMQRWGLPPSYPRLKMPGVSAPIPEGASWGPGGWGTPPMDAYGRPVYPGVYATTDGPASAEEAIVAQIKSAGHWGDLEEEEWETDSEDDGSDDDDDDEEELAEGEYAAGGERDNAREADDDDGYEDESKYAGGMDTPADGMSSVASAMATPDSIHLRKASGMASEEPRLYHVLEQQATSVGGSLMGSSHTYKMPPAAGAAAAAVAAGGPPPPPPPPPSSRRGGSKSSAGSGVAVSLDPAAAESMDSDALRAAYEAGEAEASAARAGMGYAAWAEGSRKRSAPSSSSPSAKRRRS
eukprot:PLAT3354.39.p1 GENE.PLAT3354.39~~PLAT3354.39.p1  ORF type:complete len:627 (-),score=341.15 PLAT3354.39:238-2118(-)